MVAKSPPKLRKMAPLNPNLLRETVKKVDQCMARLQELQYTVSGGTKVMNGKNLSPRSTRGYLRTSVRCKQESLRMKNSAVRKSPIGKFQGSIGGEWTRMSLPAMLVGETVGEILQASKFAREIVAAVETKPKKNLNFDDPKTPMTIRRNCRPNPENTELRTRRKREKQVVLQKILLESDSPRRRRARSRITFKVSPSKREIGKENLHIAANRISPRNRPWAKKTVLFPNPMFHTSPTSQQHKPSKTRSPVITRNRETPHKFLIKSPPSQSKFQVKIRSPPVALSPTRASIINKKPQKVSTAAKLRRSLSPAKLANRFVSPLKNRLSFQMGGGFMSGLKQCPSYSSRRLSDWRA